MDKFTNFVLERLKSICEERKISFYELSQNTNLSDSIFYGWKHEKYQPTTKSIEDICEFFDITLAQFFANYNLGELTLEQENLLKNWNDIGEKEQFAIRKIILAFKDSNKK